MILKRNVNCGELYAFVCESHIEDDMEYLVGKEGFSLDKTITIKQNQNRKDANDPYLFIYDEEDNEIGAMLEDGGFIYINGQRLHCFLTQVDNRLVLRVNMFDDDDTRYYKNKLRKQEEMEVVNE